MTRTLWHLVTAALCAGLVSGLLVTALHQLATVPLILHAEVFETAAAPPPSHDAHASHDAAREPQAGLERTAATLLADMLTAIGYALVLSAAFTLRGGTVTWREGLIWGLAGFAIFSLAPGLGLPPELPGTEAAPLLDRQVWWVVTVAATAVGLGLLAFARHAAWVIPAALLIVLPHVWGAPQPAEHAAAAPEALARQFVALATVVSFLFWLTIGAATGYFYRRFQPSDSVAPAG